MNFIIFDHIKDILHTGVLLYYLLGKALQIDRLTKTIIIVTCLLLLLTVWSKLVMANQPSTSVLEVWLLQIQGVGPKGIPVEFGINICNLVVQHGMGH